MKVKYGNETYFLNEWIAKIGNETLKMTFEKEGFKSASYIKAPKKNNQTFFPIKCIKVVGIDIIYKYRKAPLLLRKH